MSKNALTSKQSSTAPPARNPNHLTVQLKEGEDPEMKMAEVHTGPYMTNAIAFTKSMRGSLGELDITAITSAMLESAKRVKANDMSDVEAMLLSQAIVLNGMFADLSSRSVANRADGHFEASQIYLKLAFKAQNQARMTLESLSNIKNPPVLYVKQANISHGPQQVNNGTASASQAKEMENSPNKLLDSSIDKPLDPRTPEPAVNSDKAMAPVGAIDGASNA